MRHLTAGLLGLALLGAVPFAVHATDADPNDASSDDRWLPWIGCWEGAPEPGDVEADGLIVCFRFLDNADGAELLTYLDGDLVSREAIQADGRPAPIEEGGCVGDRFAEWSTDGQRLFLTSEMRCGEGIVRSTRGVMSVLPDARSWVEIHGVEAGTEAPFIGMRVFVPASGAAMAELGIDRPEAQIGLAVSTARSHASAALTPDGLVEAVGVVGPSVTAALLVERGERFALDANLARSLAEQGVPAEVLDVMVALDHPNRFEIGGDARALRAEAREPEPRQVAGRSAAPWPLTSSRYYGFGSGWGLYGRYGYDPFLYNRYGYDPFYGARFGGGFYSPRVIFVGSPQVRDRTIVDPVRGYSSDQDTGRRAVPSTAGPSTAGPSTPSPSRAPRASGSSGTRSGTGTASPPSTRSSGGSSDTGRQARPRDRTDD